jgi:hypothetical protein
MDRSIGDRWIGRDNGWIDRQTIYFPVISSPPYEVYDILNLSLNDTDRYLAEPHRPSFLPFLSHPLQE